MDLEQQIGSILNFVYNLNPVEIRYDNNDLEDESGKSLIPCMICNYPELISKTSSLDSYDNIYSLYLVIAESSTQGSMKVCYKIQNEILSNKCKIPIVDEEGIAIESMLKLKDVISSKIDDGIGQIKFVWKTPVPFKTIDVEKVKRFVINPECK